MLKEVVKVAVENVELQQGLFDELALFALGGEDVLNDHVGLNDVEVAVGFDRVGLDLEVFFLEESVEVHGAL